jgi:RND family efflux transporter MFP subunit
MAGPSLLPKSLLLLALVSALVSCRQQNRYVPPPPPQVVVAPPVQRNITRYVEGTGTTAAVNSVNLVGRVEGYLVKIAYADGQTVHKGDLLFQIDPSQYAAQAQQAQSQLDANKAQLVQSEAEFNRQADLVKRNFASQAALDQARAKRDSDRANVLGAEASLTNAQITLSYTEVRAPFDGVVTNHLVSVGALVGNGGVTQLASIVQLDPIWASFTLGENDVLRIKVDLAKRGITRANIPNHISAELELQNESGFPHAGTVDYVAPELDTSTGTLTVRGIFPNQKTALLPGFFVRVRVPFVRNVPVLLVPQTAIGADQLGSTLLVVGADNTVALRHVQLGETDGDWRVIEGGLQPGERVIVEGLQRAVPGQKVVPVLQTASAQAG